MMQHPFIPSVSGEYKKIFCLNINLFNNRYHTTRKVHTSNLVSQFNELKSLKKLRIIYSCMCFNAVHTLGANGSLKSTGSVWGFLKLKILAICANFI